MTHLIKKKITPYKGKVYDLSISKSHTYNIEGKAVHNSSAGSLLAYVLGITQVDSIAHGLLYERFLVKSKKSYPDIDSDVSDREEAIQIISDFFGEENVIPVSNFAKLQLASLCKDLAKLFGVPYDLVNSYTQKMRSEALAKAKQEPGFDAQVWDFTIDEAEKNSPSYGEFIEEMKKYPSFFTALTILFKQVKTTSKHAGGVILTHNGAEAMPLLKAKGGIQTPWPEGLAARHLEDFGLLKFDILGLGTLRMFENCIRRILQRHKGIKHPTFDQIKEWYYQNLHPDNNKMNDMKVYKNVFWENRHAGIFQFSKNNTRGFMEQLKPTCINDIAVVTSLHRPGPLGLGCDKTYLQNRLNPEKIKYKTPLLEEIYKDTGGLLVFQEQLQMIYHKLGGVPLDETDAVRKAFTKKDASNKEAAQKERDRLRNEFAELCLKNNNISNKIAYEIFDDMEKFVSYSFNKSLLETTFIDVYTPDGSFIETKQIKDICCGEYVKSLNEKTQKEIFVKVLNKHDHGILDIYQVDFVNGESVWCTENHKFRLSTGDMVPVNQFNDSTMVCFVDAKTSAIKSVKYWGKGQTYDLEVDHPDHQFYLHNGALTSNSHAVSYCITTYQCIHGQTRIFDWDKKEYISVAKAFKEGNVKNIACYDEKTGKTISGKIKAIIRTTGAKNLNLKMAYVLKTKNRNLTCSKDHPILTDKGIYKHLEELQIGEKVAVEQTVLTHNTEEWKEHMLPTFKKISTSMKKHWLGVTEEQKKKHMEPIIKSSFIYREKSREGAKNFWRSLTKREKLDRLHKMHMAAMDKGGFKTRFVGLAKCGHKVYSSNELALCNWFHDNNLEHETQVRMLNTFGYADCFSKGIYIEFDGMNRPDSYFQEKFGDLPFIVLKNKNTISKELNFLLQSDNILQGNKIVYEEILSINELKETVMYDISMENEPHNFLANNFVVHNCAHLLTYFPDEWVTTYIDYCTNDKGKTSGSEDPKAVAIQEVRALGYDLVKPDINKSEYDFVNDPDDPKMLVPSMSSLKYVGKTALNEIKEYRPYKTVEDLLINRDGSWRHSNFNKRSLETLIKLEALGSMNLVGKNKTFRSYKEMLELVVGNYDLLKRISARKKNNDVSSHLKTLIAEYQTQHPEVEEWSTADKIEFSSELAGSVDMDLILPPKILSKLSELGLPCIEEWDGKGNYWAIVKEAKMATTKTGKPYLRMSLTGLESTKQNCFIWNFKKKPNEDLPKEYEIIVGTFDKSNFGLSGFGNSLYKLNDAIKDTVE
jgi:intein/homing endonuclease